METIKIYLENMFVKLPKTEKLKRLKDDIFSNMEERYQELKGEGKLENEAIGIVISEFGNIDELMEEMNIKIPDNNNESYPDIGLDEIFKFIGKKRKMNALVGIGVGLIITGVSLLIFLSQILESQLLFSGLSDNARDIIPVIFLFLFIAPAVGMFIYTGVNLERYKFIDEGQFELASETKAILEKELRDVKPKQTIGLIVGVGLCILAPVAVILGSMFEEGSTYGVSIMLVIIAVAVFLIIISGADSETYKKLMKTGEYDLQYKKENKIIEAIAGLVWPLATGIFLFCGFVFNLWHICWIIFPITGVLFGGISAFYNAMKKN